MDQLRRLPSAIPLQGNAAYSERRAAEPIWQVYAPTLGKAAFIVNESTVIAPLARDQDPKRRWRGWRKRSR